MAKTKLAIDGTRFRINGDLIYSEIANCNPKYHGMLMNSRMIQGIFDSKNREQFNRYAKTFDPDTNTNELIEALPQWYAKGLRAITVGVQGGGSCFTIKGCNLVNNPYSSDGKSVDSAYLERLDRLINACDEIGIIVMVSFLYCENIKLMAGAQPVINAVKTMSSYLKEKSYTNVIIEVANEYNIKPFENYPIVQEAQGMVALIDIAKEYSGGLPVGCSPGGGSINEEVCKASDVVLLHGNGQSRGKLYNLLKTARRFCPDSPIVINEDSPAIGQITVCEELAVSWGYYNNMTKQEPPTYWEITKGEDEFFAYRMAEMLGIEQEEIPEENQYYLQGMEEHMHCNNERFIRVASLYPEKVDFVRFYCNGEHVYTCYDETFMMNYECNWRQTGVQTKNGDVWSAEITLRDGTVKIITETVKNI